MFDKRDDFDFNIVIFPLMDVEAPGHLSYGVYTRDYQNYVDFSHDLKTVQTNILKFQLTINLLKSKRFPKVG